MKLLVILALICYTHRCNGHELSKRLAPVNSSLIVGGENAKIEEYPAMAFLFITSSASFAYCGGTIISKLFILTAANCLMRWPNRIAITVGSKDVSDKNAKQYITPKYKVHPNFKGEGSDYDIGLVQTLADMELGATTKPIQLASSGSKVSDGEMLTAVGWGRFSEKFEDVNSVLKKVQVPVVNFSKCQEIYSTTAIITSRIFCAGDMQGGKGFCNADGGGPAINSAGVQVGIIVGSTGCARQGYPGIYTDIASLRDWIKTEAKV